MTASRPLALLVSLGLALLLAAPAAASPQTLKRSLENIVMAPLDVAAAPVTAGTSIVRNLREVEDSPAVRIFYPLPGYAWVTMNNIGAGVLRGVAGILELVPGMILLFSETDMSPLFPPAEDNNALVNFENPLLDVKFGVDYTTTP